MNVYDFDKTIMDGDSTLLFIKYLYTKKFLPLCILKSIFFGFLYLIKLCPKQKAKEIFFEVFKHFDDMEERVSDFWDHHMNNIKSFYLKQRRDDDLVISASPEFLIKEACKRLNISCIGSPVDIHTGKFFGLNCHGEEKVRRFREKYTDSIQEFYSDSYSDNPLAKLSKNAYLVKGEEIQPW